jgi:hypothetical protein
MKKTEDPAGEIFSPIYHTPPRDLISDLQSLLSLQHTLNFSALQGIIRSCEQPTLNTPILA